MKHSREKKNEISKSFRILSVVLLVTITLTLGAAASAALAYDRNHRHDEDEIPFAEAHLFFELNNTDGDLGIHALIDGDAWKRLIIEDPREHRMLDVKVRGRLRKQGLTEIFFESAEPSFEELDPKDFFRRFPAGTYEIEGETLDGIELESEVELTHTMPAPPEPTVNGKPMAEVCDEEDPDFAPTLVTSLPVIIEWDEVKWSHPDPLEGGAGVQPPIPVNIVNYEAVLEVVIEEDGKEFTSKLSIILPPGQRSITVPEEFINLGEEFKYEILAREESYNQTAVESCFVLDLK